ncbi:MAG: hypothetical protein M0R77_19190 [Gammaproteobacteria bacterium]|nr:hypothetical protein [Gammaproteobacteria bacterium]
MSKLYDISELFFDDTSRAATFIKICGAVESHTVIMKRIQSGNITKISHIIDLAYNLIQDRYNIDGIIAIVEAVHSITPHNEDMTFVDEVVDINLFQGEPNA